jgi:hypothetical protein
MGNAIAWLLVGMPVWFGMTATAGSPPPLALPPGASTVRTMVALARPSSSPQPSDERLMLAGDNGPRGGGTNPYVVAIVHLRGDGDVTRRVLDLQQRYGFSWDHAVFARADDVAIRIALRRGDIPSLAREDGVARIEPISGSPF